MSDTICAIATALSPSGIGIVRISGDEAIQIADRIFKKPNGESLLNVPSHTVHYGFIKENVNGQTQTIDEVMAVVMKAPHSFTKEDTVEIDCHGGIYILKRVLNLLLENGGRLAEPGEFTKRAFLNGRIDLSKAEAVMDLISSSNENARKNSIHQLEGRLYNLVVSVRENILYEVAFIESAIDDPEHFDAGSIRERLTPKVKEDIGRLNRLSSSFDNGRLMSQGIRTTIVGKPNVGKSSFLNLLLGEERAIVTKVAGTTRDTLEENVSIDGITLHLIDTAGIHDTSDEVEIIGVKKAKDSIVDADLVIFIMDSSEEINEDDKNLIPLLSDKNVIVLLNKTDLSNPKFDEASVEDLFVRNADTSTLKVLPFSAKTAEGLSTLTDYIKEVFFSGTLSTDEEIYLTSLRHKNLVEEALKALHQVEKSLDEDMPEDFYSIDLMQAYSSLGLIIGEEVDDDLVDEIFSKFCMGK